MPEPQDHQQTGEYVRESSFTAAYTPHPDDTPGTDSGTAPVPQGRAGRFELFGEIARGGMGAILRGRDPDLNRELAVKVLLENYRDRPEMAQRFIKEAQVGGGLQHPGIVPVYELGRFDDERPFFAMKLIEGRTLSVLLRERPAPADDLPRFLKIFEQICQTLAYAHSRGVIHRDLKPLNVMVGAFGEMQVMDWGLAKVLGAADAAGSPPAEGPPQSDDSYTVAGQMLGTPAYIPPEQARGEIADERADVFGLGAILCEILTGRPPYIGERTTLVARARSGDVVETFNRLDASGADADLLQLARDCLAPDRKDRPANGQAVADRMTAYLAGVQEKLKAAEIARAAAQAKAVEERKRRRVQLALALAVLLIAAGGAAGGFWFHEQRVARQAELALRTVETERGVEAVLREAESLREQVRRLEDDPERSFGPLAAALTAIRHGEELIAGGPCRDELQERVRQLREQLDTDELDRQILVLLEGARLQQTVEVEGRFRTERAAPFFREAFQRAGIDPATQAPAEVAERISQRSIRRQLLSALDEWGRCTHNAQERQTLIELAARLDAQGDSFHRRFHDAVVRRDRQALRLLRNDPEVRQLPATMLILVADVLASVGAIDDAVVLLRTGRRRFPGDFWINEVLGIHLRMVRPPRHDEAIHFLTAAQALRPQSAGAIHNLAGALYDAGRLEQALDVYKQVLEVDSTYVNAHFQMGIVLDALKRPQEAARAYDRSLELLGKTEAADAQLVLILMERKDWGKLARKVKQLLQKTPKHVVNRNLLGFALDHLNRLEEAEAEYRKAIAVDPEFALAHGNLGYLLLRKNRRKEAFQELRRAIELDPNQIESRLNLGYALYLEGQREAALAEFRHVIELDPNNIKAHTNVGGMLQLLGRKKEAIVAARKAVEINPDLPEAHLNLGSAILGDNLEEAITCYRRALKLQPDHALAHCNLGQALRYQKKFAAALAELKHGNELAENIKPWPHPSQRWQAEVEKLVALDEQLSAIRRGRAIPKDAGELLALAAFCHQQNRGQRTAARFYEQAFAVRPALVTDLARGYGQTAARIAARVGSGEATDADPFDETDRVRWRKKALDWLRANLAVVVKLTTDEPNSSAKLSAVLARWQKDTDLAALRDPAARQRLAQAERDSWQAFWSEVETVRGRIAAAPKK